MSTEVRKVTVKDGGQMVRWLNELEYIKGEIWANVYQVHCVVCWLICVSDSAHRTGHFGLFVLQYKVGEL